MVTTIIDPSEMSEGEFILDLMALAETMLTQLAEGKLDDLRTSIRGLQDELTERLGIVGDSDDAA